MAQPSRRVVAVGAVVVALLVFVVIGLGAAYLLRSLNGSSGGTLGLGSGGKSQNEELKVPLLRSFADGITGGRDLERSDRDQALEILREADPLLARVREENRKALEGLKTPPTLDRSGSSRAPSAATPGPSGE